MRKYCPMCGFSVRIKNNGTFYSHAKIPQTGLSLTCVVPDNKCAGSNHTPADATNLLMDNSDEYRISWYDPLTKANINIVKRFPDLHQANVWTRSNSSRKNITISVVIFDRNR